MGTRYADDITQGDRLRSANWGGIRATESAHPADLRLSPHRHASTCLTYVLDGEFLESVEGREFHMRRGTVLLKCADAMHTNQFGRGGARSLLVELPDAMIDRFEAARSLFEADPVRAVPSASPSAHRIHADLLEPDPGAYSAAHAARASDSPDRRHGTSPCADRLRHRGFRPEPHDPPRRRCDRPAAGSPAGRVVKIGLRLVGFVFSAVSAGAYVGVSRILGRIFRNTKSGSTSHD